MQILNNDYWNSYLKPYVADMGVALAFGVGCLLFKAFKKNDKQFSKTIKETIKKTVSKWNTATSLQKYHSLIINNNDKKVDAYKILKSMGETELIPDTVTYNCLIFMSFQLEQHENAFKLYEEIADITFPVQPDIITYNILLKGLVKEIKESMNINNNGFSKKDTEKFKEQVKYYQNEIARRKLKYDDFTFNTIIDAFIECGDLNSAWATYENMKSSYNSELKKQDSNETDHSSNNTANFDELKEKVIRPDIYTYTTLIKGLKNSTNNNEHNLNKILEIYENIKSGLFDNVKVDEFLINSVLDSCIKFEKLNTALSIFKEMKLFHIFPSVVTYSIILKGYSNFGRLDDAMDLLNQMSIVSVKPNEIIYDCLLNCAIKCQRLDKMKEIYENMKKDKVTPNGVIYSTLVKGFNRTKNYNLAFNLYDSLSPSQIEKCDIVFFNALLDCCVEGNNKTKMLEVFAKVLNLSESVSESSFSPTVITYSTLLKGYTKFNMHEEAKALYTKFMESDRFVDEVFFNTMADYYAKLKDASNALGVLKDLKAKSVIRSSVIYSILIKLYSSLGEEQKAISVYEEMKTDGIKATMITYTTIMQMFIKMKKLDQAIGIFYEMRENKITVDAVTYNFIINGCSFNKKLETAIEILELSFKENIKLNENTYNNVLDYIASNKFMRINERIQSAGQILKNLKERNISVKYEVYSKVMKMMYQSNEKLGEKEIENFGKFTSLRKDNQSSNGSYSEDYGYSQSNQRKSYNVSIYEEPQTTPVNNSIKSQNHVIKTNNNNPSNCGFNRSGKFIK